MRNAFLTIVVNAAYWVVMLLLALVVAMLGFGLGLGLKAVALLVVGGRP